MRFKTKKEAEEYLEAMRQDVRRRYLSGLEHAGNEIFPLFFCPLLKETCRTDCVCYALPCIQRVTDGYDIGVGFCRNDMFGIKSSTKILTVNSIKSDLLKIRAQRKV